MEEIKPIEKAESELLTILTIEKALNILKPSRDRDNMRRKVIKQGHNTLTVTLPSDWVKRLNIQPGSELDMSELNNGLFLSTEKKSGVKKVEFDITGLDIPTIWKYFMAVYREGYDEMVVKFEPNMILETPYKYMTQHRYDPKYKNIGKQPVVAAIQNFVSRFIGLEVVEHGRDFVRIKEMGELTSKEFDNSLRRMFFLMEQMAEETNNAAQNNDPKFLKSMHDVDITMDKFHDYCVRILNKMGNKDPKRTSLLFSMMFIMELAADEFKNISHHLTLEIQAKKFNKNISQFTGLVNQQVGAFQNLFYKYDKNSLKEIARIDQEIYLNAGKFYEKTTEEEKEILHHLRMISRFFNSLMELRIEMEF
jgi:phosphate uptake regulator